MKTVVRLAALALTTAALTGCSFGSSNHADEVGPMKPVAAVLPASVDFGPVLQQISLRQSDFKAPYVWKLMPKGDQVKGQATLSDCGHTYKTESKRLARRQYELYQGSSTVGLSNEVVAYDSAADAAAALAEFRQAISHCAPPVAGVTETVTSARAGLAQLPVAANETVSITLSDNAGHRDYDMAVFQVHGRYLDGVYLQSGVALTATDAENLMSVAGVTGERLSHQA